jgi:hypothetical protein
MAQPSKNRFVCPRLAEHGPNNSPQASHDDRGQQSLRNKPPELPEKQTDFAKDFTNASNRVMVEAHGVLPFWIARSIEHDFRHLLLTGIIKYATYVA